MPQYCLGRGLIDMTANQVVSDAFKVFGENYFRNPLNWDVIGKNLFALFVQGCVFLILHLAIEFGFWRNKLPCLKAKQ